METMGSGPHLHPAACFFIDWDRAREFSNEYYDQMVAAASESDGHLRLQKLNDFESRLETLERDVTSSSAILSVIGGPRARGTWMAKLFCSMLLPSVPQISSAEARATTKLELAKFAVTMELYRMDHGQYPESLDDSGLHLPALPMDPFSGVTIKHRKTETGFLLYSVGPDGADDGGITIEQRSPGSNGFDVPFRVGG